MLTAAIGVFICLRAGSNARFGPLLGLAVPVGRLLVSVRYRSRLRAEVSRIWGQVVHFSKGWGPIPWAAAFAFVSGPFFVLDLCHGGFLGTFDTRPVIPTAVSLVREGNWDLREFDQPRIRSLLREPDGQFHYCFHESGGRIVSTFPSGMVPFALAVVAPAYLCGANLDSPQTLQHLEKVTAALVASLSLGLFFLTASCLGSAEAAGIVTVLLATGSGVFTIVGLGTWQHGGVIVWLLLALLVEFSSRSAADWRGTLVQGFALGQMLECRPTAGLLVALFGLWVLVRSPRRGMLLGIISTLAVAPWIAFHALIHHSVLGPATVTTNTSPGLWAFFQTWQMIGTLASPGRGLFVYQPWAILAIGTLFTWPRSRSRTDLMSGPAGWVAFAGLASLLHLVLVSAWWDWPGGYTWGSRLSTDILPLLGLLAVPTAALLMNSGVGRSLLLTLFLLGLAVHWPCVLWEAHRWNWLQPRDYWSWSNAPFLYHPPCAFWLSGLTGGR
ncbi:MAG: hypothetical protein JO161_06205 [Planctomycetaceae bacterium]|nr:hypothetical protein [Planctomycetaceae bacterium]